MMKASESQVLAAFEQVHGQLTGSCRAEVVYGENSEILGVACMKGSAEAWRSSIAEILFDLLVMDRSGA